MSLIIVLVGYGNYTGPTECGGEDGYVGGDRGVAAAARGVDPGGAGGGLGARGAQGQGGFRGRRGAAGRGALGDGGSVGAGGGRAGRRGSLGAQRVAALGRLRGVVHRRGEQPAGRR